MKRKHQTINLMPSSYRRGWLPSVDTSLVGGLGLSVFVCASIFGAKFLEIRSLRREVQSISAKSHDLDNKISVLRKTLDENSYRVEQQKLVNEVIGTKYPWAEAFKELSLVIPKRTWLTSFNAANKGGNIAVSLSGETDSQSQMANFFSNLEKSVYLNRLVVVSSKQKKSVSPSLFEFVFASPDAPAENRTPGSAK